MVWYGITPCDTIAMREIADRLWYGSLSFFGKLKKNPPKNGSETHIPQKRGKIKIKYCLELDFTVWRIVTQSHGPHQKHPAQEKRRKNIASRCFSCGEPSAVRHPLSLALLRLPTFDLEVLVVCTIHKRVN